MSESKKYIHLSCLLFSSLYNSLPAHSTTEEQSLVEAEGEEEEVEVDVVGVDPVPDLPFDERKVGAIMVECSRHVNLVRVPAEKSDPLLERVLGEVGHRQRELLSRLVRILEGDHLARLACTNVSESCENCLQHLYKLFLSDGVYVKY